MFNLEILIDDFLILCYLKIKNYMIMSHYFDGKKYIKLAAKR